MEYTTKSIWKAWSTMSLCWNCSVLIWSQSRSSSVPRSIRLLTTVRAICRSFLSFRTPASNVYFFVRWSMILMALKMKTTGKSPKLFVVGFEHALGVLWTILKTCSTVSDTTRAARRVWWQVEQGFKIVYKTTRNVQTPFWYDKSWGKYKNNLALFCRPYAFLANFPTAQKCRNLYGKFN